MIPTYYELPTGYRGDTYGPISFRFWNNSGQAINIEGVNANLIVKDSLTSCPILHWSTNDNSIIISGNRLTINNIDSQNMNMVEGNYKYDLQLLSGDVDVTYLKGILPIINDV